MLTMARTAAIAMTAVAVVIPPAAQAKPKPKPKPSESVIKKLFREAYCPDTKAPNGNIVRTAKVKLEKVKRAKARPGNIVREGVPKGTTVYPIKITFFCDYSLTPQANPDEIVNDQRSTGSFIFYKDEFGDWQQRNSGIKTVRVPD